MALWNEKDALTTPGRSNPPTDSAARLATLNAINESSNAAAASAEAARRAPVARAEAPAPQKESLIAAELSIEGKIQGTGSVRLAGRFKGDVHVEGNVSIDSGAKVDGAVQANMVSVGGELTGNIDKAKHVDVLSTGVIVGDVKADSLTVAAGSRMRGHVEFGWNEANSSRALSGLRSAS